MHVCASVCFSSCLCLCCVFLITILHLLYPQLRSAGMRFWRWFSGGNNSKSIKVGWIGFQPSSQVRFSCFVALVSLHTTKHMGCSQRRPSGWRVQRWLGMAMPCLDECSMLCVCPLKVFLWGNLGTLKTHPSAFMSPSPVTVFLESRYFWMVSPKIVLSIL